MCFGSSFPPKISKLIPSQHLFMINDFLPELLKESSSKALKTLEKGFEESSLEESKTMLRLVIFQPGHSLLGY